MQGTTTHPTCRIRNPANDKDDSLCGSIQNEARKDPPRFSGKVARKAPYSPRHARSLMRALLLALVATLAVPRPILANPIIMDMYGVSGYLNLALWIALSALSQRRVYAQANPLFVGLSHSGRVRKPVACQAVGGVRCSPRNTRMCPTQGDGTGSFRGISLSSVGGGCSHVIRR